VQENVTGLNLLYDKDYSPERKVPKNILLAREFFFPVSPHIPALSSAASALP
jgi:hypothetical protein